MASNVDASDLTPVTIPEGMQMHDALQHLSHDIRSAMSDVIGGLRLVEIGRLDPTMQTQMARVRAAADTLAALVDDALMTAAGEGTRGPGAGPVGLAEWLETLRERWTGRAAERGGTFTMREAGDLPELVRVSPVALDRIVANLVGNALIHGRGADVRLDVTATREAGLILRVVDTGPGFPDTILSALAEARATRATGATGGTGMGLQIARALSAEIGGELSLGNDPDRGGAVAELRIGPDALDWDGAGAPDPAPGATEEALPDLSDLSILVAEDNLTNQMILDKMLTRMRARTTFVADGHAALAALRNGGFDLGLIDIEMPGLSGLEVMERARADPEPLCRLPLVAITAYVLRDNREAIYEAGADGIIGKPIGQIAEFGNAILRYAGRIGPDSAPDPTRIPIDSVAFDRGRLDALLEAAGPEDRAELLTRLVADLHSVRDALGIGVAATDAAQIRSQTHILIAISGAVGARRLCQLAESLNIAAKRGRTDQLAPFHAPLRDDLDRLLEVIAALQDAPG
ncbi:ATP-binding protein [Hasllibacter sp. MH4015]|uniref:ATP-binding protein n=1 Tax=Hasllibacter sp. MH4015 TaxID=2854029 RepID=UPI001CD1DB71|nr:ATP-binding protein [Hasllibacter sp. MH4015]